MVLHLSNNSIYLFFYYYYVFFGIFFSTDRLVKLLICTVNLNEEQEKEVEKSLTQAVKNYLKFHDSPVIEEFSLHLVKVYQVSLVTVSSGSIIITVECPTLESLDHLWSDYLSGELDKVAERCFVTDEMKKKLNLDKICLKTIIDEEDYLNCRKALMELPSTCLGEYKQEVWKLQRVLH